MRKCQKHDEDKNSVIWFVVMSDVCHADVHVCVIM